MIAYYDKYILKYNNYNINTSVLEISMIKLYFIEMYLIRNSILGQTYMAHTFYVQRNNVTLHSYL